MTWVRDLPLGLACLGSLPRRLLRRVLGGPRRGPVARGGPYALSTLHRPSPPGDLPVVRVVLARHLRCRCRCCTRLAAAQDPACSCVAFGAGFNTAVRFRAVGRHGCLVQLRRRRGPWRTRSAGVGSGCAVPLWLCSRGTDGAVVWPPCRLFSPSIPWCFRLRRRPRAGNGPWGVLCWV